MGFYKAGLLGSKKGQLHNYMAAIILLLVFGLVSFIAYVIWNNFVTGFTSSGLYTGAVQTTGDKFTSMFLFHDWLILVLIIALGIGIIVTSYKLRTTALGYIITFMFGLFFLLISFFMNYFFGSIIDSGSFTAYLLYFPRTSMALTNLHWIGFVYLILGSLALYGKRGDNDTEGYLR